MRKKVDTGIPTCDLCDKIAVEVLDSGARCEKHTGDPSYFRLKGHNIELRAILAKILKHGTAKVGHERDYAMICHEAEQVLWRT